jgi:hypothetical protein
MTQLEAENMIAEIEKWLENGAPGNTVILGQYEYEGEAVWLAREFSQRLLGAADASGLGGCQLCQN